MDTTSVTEDTGTPKALVAAPKGTTPNTLIHYPAGSVTSPASISAPATGHKNVSQNMSGYQVPT